MIIAFFFQSPAQPQPPSKVSQSIKSWGGRGDGEAPPTPSPASAPKPSRSAGLRLNEILLWVFTRDVLGVRLVVEREILAVLLFDFHFLVPIRLFPLVEESGGYRQAGHNHENHHCYDTCNAEDIYSEIYIYNFFSPCTTSGIKRLADRENPVAWKINEMCKWPYINREPPSYH